MDSIAPLLAFADPPAEAALFSLASLIALLTITSLEIVLGIDNVIFIAILAGKLPPEQRDRARVLGLQVAVVSRILLLLAIGFIVQLDKTTLFVWLEHDFTVKDLVLVVGGLFLLGKATLEIHHKVAHAAASQAKAPQVATMRGVLLQVLAVDVVFSLDSVITAAGLTRQLPIMIVSVLVATAVMLAFSKTIVDFIDRYPALKVLALSFLVLIGALLVAEGCGQKVGKGYVYFAMAFAVLVEALQILSERPAKPETPPAASP